MPAIIALPRRTSLLSMTQVARMLGVSRSEAYRRMRRREFPARKYLVLGQHQWRVRPKDLKLTTGRRVGPGSAPLEYLACLDLLGASAHAPASTNF